MDRPTIDRVYSVRREVRLRDARPNDGRCGNVSAALEAEFGWERQWGYLKLIDNTVSWVHCWNRLADGTIVDATADQFQDLWLGDVVVLDATDTNARSHYLNAPTQWELRFEERGPEGAPSRVRCRSEHDERVITVDDGAQPWRSLAHAVLRLLTHWDLHSRLVTLTAVALRAKASTSDTATTSELTRPLVTDSIQHLARRLPEPWIAAEFAEPIQPPVHGDA